MNITFDHAKNVSNIAKHGISLADAALIDWDTALTWPDVRQEYGEDRYAGLGLIGQRVFYVVFVDRAQTRRIISLRKANAREVKRYVET